MHDSVTGPDLCRFKFSSKERERSCGLSYYGYRFYAPHWQRWLNGDPIFERGGINLYGFLLNNPMSWVDDFGNAARRGGKGVGKGGGAGTGVWKKCLKGALVVTCTACTVGLAMTEAFCISYQSQGYQSFHDCLCDYVNNNKTLQNTCQACGGGLVDLPNTLGCN